MRLLTVTRNLLPITSFISMCLWLLVVIAFLLNRSLCSSRTWLFSSSAISMTFFAAVTLMEARSIGAQNRCMQFEDELILYQGRVSVILVMFSIVLWCN